MASFIRLQILNPRARGRYARLIAGIAGVAMLSAAAASAVAGSGREPVTMCLNRNHPEGTVITKSVRRSGCGAGCEAELQVPTGHRMLICRGQAIPKGYKLELLTTTPDCACYGRDQNAYMIKVDPADGQPADDEVRPHFPL